MMQIMWYWYVLSVVAGYVIGTLVMLSFVVQEAIEKNAP